MKTLPRSAVLLLALAASTPVQAQWSTGMLSQARWRFVATTVGNKALFAGGSTSTSLGSASPLVDIYDATMGPPSNPDAWSTSSLSVPRFQLAATTVGTKAMFAGGKTVPSGGVQAVVDIYDDSTGMWTMDMLSQARGNLSAVTLGQWAMFAGGVAGGTTSDVVDVYDNLAGTWSTATLSVPRVSIGTTTVGNYAFFAGGLPSPGMTSTDRVDIYDASIGPPSDPLAWSTHALSQKRCCVGATSAGTEAIFAGGDDHATSTVYAVVDIYDDSLGLHPSNPNAWRTDTLSQARSHIAATTLGDVAIFAGGETVSNGAPFPPLAVTSVVDFYDSTNNAWCSSLSALSQARWVGAASTVGGTAMFAGGADTGSVFNIVDVYSGPGAIGTKYCTPAVPNSTGVSGVISASGLTCVAFNDVTITADQLPSGQFGYLLTSQTQGFFMPPGSSGFICLGGNIGRYNGNVGQGPSFSLQIDLTSMPVNPPQPVQPGATWNFQAWYRDVGNTNNFTDGVSILFE